MYAVTFPYLCHSARWFRNGFNWKKTKAKMKTKKGDDPETLYEASVPLDIPVCKLFRRILCALLHSTSNTGFVTYHWLTSYRQEMSETIGVCLPIFKKFDKFQKPFVDQLCICSEVQVKVLLVTTILLLGFSDAALFETYPCNVHHLVLSLVFCPFLFLLFFCCAVLIVKPILDDDDDNDNLLMASTKR